MIKLNTAYTIENGDTVTFTEGKKGTINGAYKDATLTGAFDGNVLKATFHNTKVNATGLMEITFHENGFDAAWKKGLELGPMRGKWEGILETSSDFNVSIPDDIKVLLEQHLIKPNVGIDAVYNWFFGYYKNQFNGNEKLLDFSLYKNELSDQFKEIKQKDTRTIGIDFPILLSKGKNRPILMVCAMDPLREESDDISKIDEIGYWVPFSIINNPVGQTKHSEKENLAFFHTLLDTYDLYVTDIFKLFYRKDNRISNTIVDFRSLPVHRTILDAEIQIVKPSVILTLGNNARDAMCELLNLPTPHWTSEIYMTKDQNGIDVVMVPHISGAANGAKAPILKNPAYEGISGKNNVKYAQIIIKSLNS